MDALSIFASRFTPPRAQNGEALSCSIPSLTGSSDAFLALTLALGRGGEDKGQRTEDKGRVVLVVTPGLPDADRLADDLRLLTSQPASHPSSPVPHPYSTRVLEFPPPLDDDKSALGTRLKTIAALKAWALCPYPCVVVAAFPSLSCPVTMGTDPLRLTTKGPRSSFLTSGMDSASPLDSASPPSFAALCDKLASFGYERLPQVEKEGDCSVRGGIVDFWSPGDEFPVRAEFFGDDLESLRTFNPASQVSIERIDSSDVLPIREAGGACRASLASSSSQASPTRTTTLLDLLPPDATILALEHNSYNLSSLIPRPPSLFDESARVPAAA